MIVPSIDIMGGQAVQLIEGKEKVLDAGDPVALSETFGLVGEVGVIDLDAAIGRGSNETIIQVMLERASCRVGGGIRDERTAVRWLDAGAARIIIGTAATPALLSRLPTERVMAALDSRDNDVVVDGWTRSTGATVEDRIDELKPYVGGFLVTFVEGEGHMGGLPMDRVRRIVERAAPVRVTVAGGTRSVEDIVEADRAGADVQVGMALYTGAMDLAAALCAPVSSDRADNLMPTVVVDEQGIALGLVYSSVESVRRAIETKQGVYYSRSRGGLWVKGETSGNVQVLRRIDVDCDRDALRFTVRQAGRGFCHTGSSTCFGAYSGLARLGETIRARLETAPAGSYTHRLVHEAGLLEKKLAEEAIELGEASEHAHATHEAADVMYFAMVAAARRGVSLADIDRELDRRAMRVSRRAGDAKPETP